MKRILKITLKLITLIFGLLLLAVASFYFWAGSSTLEEDDYFQLKRYNVEEKLAGDTLKIMTYNMGYLSGMTNNLPMDRSAEFLANNMSRTTAFINAMDADIIAFQEIDFNAKRSNHINQLDSMAWSGNYVYSAKAVNWDKSYVPFPYWPVKFHFGKTVSGQAVLSKMQLFAQEVTVLDKPKSAPFYYNKFYLDRLVQVAFLKVNDTDTLIVMNTHLEAFDQETREKQSEIVVKMFNSFATDFPVILLGDFNAIPPFSRDVERVEPTLKKLFNDSGIGEAVSRADYIANEEQYYTFDSVNPYERLDFIFYTNSRIQKVASGVAHEASDVSDHLPVWMSFTLKR